MKTAYLVAFCRFSALAFLSTSFLTGCSSGGGSGSGSTATGGGGGSSVPLAIASISPTDVPVGSAAITLVVKGTGFTSSSIVSLSGAAEPTTFVSTTEVDASIASGQLMTGQVLSVSVANGSVSVTADPSTAALSVDNPVPAITGVTPATIPLGSTAATISIAGTNFVPGAALSVNGSPRTTTYVSSTQLTAALTSADFASAQVLPLNVINPKPGGGTSGTSSLGVNNPTPAISSFSPTSLVAGSAATVVTINGSGFLPGTVLQINGATRAATYVSSSQLTVGLLATDIATAGSLAFTTQNPQPGGGTSAVASFPIAAKAQPTPVLTSVSPTSFVAGSSASFLYVYGTSLVAASQVQWNGTPLTGGLYTVNGVAVYLYAQVPASLLTTPGTASITVNTPGASAVSNALTVNITNPPAPTLTSISPAGGPIGTAQTITFSGTGFNSKSIVSYNGTALGTTFTSSTSLTATLPASSVAVPGNGSFTVNTPAPGGGTSAAVNFTAYVPIVNNDMIYNPVNGLFYLSVPSSAGAPYGNTIVSIDPVTGAFGTPIPVGSEPNRLAITADGKYLWVGIDGANAVRKVDLTTGTAGLQFSIPQQSSNSVGNSSAYALAALPGATDSVLVSSSNFPNYFSIYDSGVVRGTPISGYYTQPYAILADGTRNEVYASGSNGYQTFTYNASGLSLKTTASSSISVPYRGDMQIVSGELYPSNGKVYDAESGALQGTLYLTGNTIASGSTFADAALAKIFVLDVPSGNYYYSTSYQVQVFSATDYTSSTVIPVTVATTSNYTLPSRLTRWGSNGLAFHNSAAFYSLRSNLVKDLSGTSADLGVSIATSGASTSAPVTFTLTVANSGGSAATNVVVAAALPASGTVTSASSTVGSCSTVTTLACNLGTLANGASATITVSVQPFTAGSLTLGAQVMGSENDPVPSNNAASSTVTVTGADYNALPTVTSISPAAIKAGSVDTMLTINGSGFNSSSTVMLGSTSLIAKLVSSTQITATVPAANLASMGWTPVTVTSPAPGGGASAPAPLTVFSVVTAGLNNLVYEPFSRKIYASVGSGSSTLTGNSIVQLTPETGSFNTPVNIGSQPTRIALTSDGKYLYTTLSGANSIARFNIGTNATEFTFSPTMPTNYYSSTNGFTDVAVQPGSDTVLAVNYGSSGTGLVDVNATNQTGTLRGNTVTSNYYSTAGGAMRFFDANSLYLYDGSLERYGVPAAGLAYGTTHTGTYLQPFGTFMLSGKYAYSDNGGIADISGSAPVQIGAFNGITSTSYTYNQKVAGDAGLNRAFFAGYTGSSSSSVDGLLAYNQSTLLPTTILPLGMATIEGNTSYTVTDMVRWGQDGIAMLTSTGHVYLLRGAAVVSGFLSTSSAASLTSASSSTITHGAGNTLLTLTGSNFQPGVAVAWNGTYRTTTLVDATHVTVAIPASDVTSAGSGTLVATNPGASASGSLTITVQ